MLYLFDNYVLDTEQRELRRDHDTIALQPQVFDLLEYLIRKRDRVVTKDDLIAAIWGGRIVSESALTTRINAARTAIGDSGDEQRLIKTLPRKGIRFVGTVREEGRPASETILTVAQPLPRLSIVVLPFANFSGDAGQDYFADGITESLTTDLSRISGSFVIARNTAFTFKENAVGAQKLGKELNVRYVLEGSVQRGGNRLRVNVQLIDAGTGSHLWAERFDKPIADLFDMQDEIVSSLANTLNAQLIEAEARRAARSHNPDAMDLYFQGTSCWNKGMTPEYMAQAKAFFERALTLDPGHVEALVAIAAVDSSVGGNFMVDDRDARFAAAEATVTKALTISPQHTLGGIWYWGPCSTQRGERRKAFGNASWRWRWIETSPTPMVSSVWRRLLLAAARKPKLISRKRFGSLPAISLPFAGCTMSALPNKYSATTPGRLCGYAGRLRPIGIIRLRISSLPPRLPNSISWKRRGRRYEPGLRSIRLSPFAAREEE